MSQQAAFFGKYINAYTYALRKAREDGIDYGVEKVKLVTTGEMGWMVRPFSTITHGGPAERITPDDLGPLKGVKAFREKLS